MPATRFPGFGGIRSGQAEGEAAGKQRLKMEKIVRVIAPLAAALLMTGCSLLKFSIDTGETPLPPEELNMRMMTRGFYYDMADRVARAADSIASASPDAPVQMRAIRWKIEATRAGVTAAMQRIPEVALLDTWLLCRRMDGAFGRLPDSVLFGPFTPFARETAGELDRRAGALARSLLTPERFALMERFVDERPAAESADARIRSDNTTLAWVEYLRANGIEVQYAVGTIAEVTADMGDRFGSQSEQLISSIGWSKDLLEIQFRQDSIRDRLAAQLDSLESDFRRMVGVMEGLPELTDGVMAGFNERVAELIGTMNAGIDNAFSDLDRQRMEVQRYVSAEREALIGQAQQAVDAAVQGALDRVPGLVGRLLFYVVLFALVMRGLPFVLGFWLGRWRERARRRRETSPGGDR